MPAVRQASVRLVGGMAFEAVAGSGNQLTMDASSEHGGDSQGFSPTELLLVGLGGCTGMDVISILRKMRQQVTAYQVEVQGTRRDEHPRIFTDIQVVHVVRGHDVDPSKVAHAVELSATRYCPVSAMLSVAADVKHTFRIEAAEQETKTSD